MEQEVRLPNSERQPGKGLPETKRHYQARVPMSGTLTNSDSIPTSLASLNELISIVQKNYPTADTELIARAYTFSETAHKDQKRSSGESYFNHPLEVAKILAELKLDTNTVMVGLLHDTVEDTVASLE